MKKYIFIISIILGTLLLDQLSKGLLIYLITGTVPLAGAAWDVVPVPYLMANVFDFLHGILVRLFLCSVHWVKLRPLLY